LERIVKEKKSEKKAEERCRRHPPKESFGPSGKAQSGAEGIRSGKAMPKASLEKSRKRSSKKPGIRRLRVQKQRFYAV
jgi:hypothetical protein